MSKPSALVTGANRGIGLEIARQLLQRGYYVFATGRNQQSLDRAIDDLKGVSPSVEGCLLDVTDGDSISALASLLIKRGVKLNVLVNNAAILLDGQKDILTVSEDEVKSTLNANTIAPLIVTKSMLPLMGDGDRIVMMSSGAGEYCSGVSAWAPIYSLSKTGLNAITRQLARALSPRGITVNAVCPGWVQTDMGGAGASREVEKGAETPVWLATEVTETGKFWRDKQEIQW